LTILFALVVGFSSFAAFGRRGRPDGTRDTFAPALRPIPLLDTIETFADRLRVPAENACALTRSGCALNLRQIIMLDRLESIPMPLDRGDQDAS